MYVLWCYTDQRRCSDLERAVEDLSELLESPIEPENIPKLRQEMTNKTVRRILLPFLIDIQLMFILVKVYVRNRNEIMLADTAKGFLEGRWSWNVSVDGFD